jgi:hypothetical protein
MNKKSIRNKTSQPVQKALPAAVHAAAMSLDGETAGAASGTVADDVHMHDVTADTAPDTAVDTAVDTNPAADVSADASADHAPKKSSAGRAAKPTKAEKAEKAEKPGKPVTFSLTLPATEAYLFEELRQTHQADGAKLKKSILLRAALLALAEADEARVTQIVAGLQPPADDKPAAKRKSKK